MKNLRLLLLYILTFISAFAHGADRAEFAAFLNRLGFEDYSAQAAAAGQQEGLTDVSKAVLTETEKRYQVVNAARELTLMIVEGSFDHLRDPRVQERALNLATYLLEPHAYMIYEPLPAAVDQIKEPKAFAEARAKFLKKRLQERYQDERNVLLVAVSDLAPAADIHAIDRNLQAYLKSKYQDPELQQTRFWGRALAASLVKESRNHGFPELESALAKKLFTKGLWLGNFVSSTVHYKDHKNEIITVKLASGDFVNEYSKGSESFFISIGVEPTNPKDRALADKEHLLGKKRYVPFYSKPSEEAELLEKVRDRVPLTMAEKTQYAFLQNEPLTNGYSHVGYIEIKKDAASGIEMPWVWDVYPGIGIGGVRFSGLEGFAYPDKFRSIGFVRYNGVKFYQHFQKTPQTRGYLTSVWKSWGVQLDNEGSVLEDQTKSYVWQTHISAAEVEALRRTPESQAEAWYAQEIIPRVLKVMKSYFVSKDALAFALNFANAQSAAYCSQLIVLSFLQGVNVDPQVNLDMYAPLLKAVEKFDDSLKYYIKRGERIISPSGFAWQSQLVQSHVMIHFTRAASPTLAGASLLTPLRARIRTQALPPVSELEAPPEDLNRFYEDAR